MLFVFCFKVSDKQLESIDVDAIIIGERGRLGAAMGRAFSKIGEVTYIGRSTYQEWSGIDGDKKLSNISRGFLARLFLFLSESLTPQPR